MLTLLINRQERLQGPNPFIRNRYYQGLQFEGHAWFMKGHKDLHIIKSALIVGGFWAVSGDSQMCLCNSLTNGLCFIDFGIQPS